MKNKKTDRTNLIFVSDGPFFKTYKIEVSFSCVCPVIDHEFRHHIVKVAVDPQTTLTMF